MRAALSIGLEREIEASEFDQTGLAQALFSVIYDASKISASARGKTALWSPKWAKLMFSQGHDRFLEFRQRIDQQISADEPPLEWPITIQSIFDRISDLESLLGIDTDEKTLVRGQIVEFGRDLRSSKIDEVRRIGDKLLELVDDQSVRATISWAEFLRNVRTLLEGEEQTLTQALKKAAKPFDW
jgi:hypothetical protein